MVKLIKQKKGNLLISVPRSYVEHFKWSVDDSRFGWQITPNGLSLVELHKVR